MFSTIAWALAVTLSVQGIAPPGPQAPAPTTPPGPSSPAILGELQAQAGALRPLVRTPTARLFLDLVPELPDPGTRLVWRSADKREAWDAVGYERLPVAARDGLTKRECSPTFYYTTGYGSPLVYARPLDVAAEAGFEAGGAKVLDFGYGLIGHLRLLAMMGTSAQGVDVEPVFRALYAQDQGPVAPGKAARAAREDTPAGALGIHHGSWPGDAAVKEGVGGGYDLIISKNVLKRGYVHPEREVDPKFLVHLGVSDAEFIAALHGALKPGGLVLIYNISPAQNPADKPYLPHADPRCAFSREDLEAGGFEVVKYDEDDQAAVIALWDALGYFKPEEQREPEKHIFARYTLVRKR